MASAEEILWLFERFVKETVKDLEAKAKDMTPDEILDVPIWPDFDPEAHQYLDKPVGYVCQTPAGNIVKLVQPYDSNIYKDPPESLPAQWGFYWGKDPKHAKEFQALSTSPYMVDEVCLCNGEVYRSKIDNNVWSPADAPQYWEKV